MKIQMTLVTASVSLMLGFALPVAALSVGGGANSALGVSADGGDPTHINVNASTDANASAGGTSAGLGAQVNGVVHDLLDASSSKGDSGTAATGSAGASASALPIMFTRSDIETVAASGTLSAASDVHADAELSAYIAGQMKADPSLQEVQATDDALSVTYSVPAKLFGFIPTSVNATALVDATGEVTVSYPWYSFLLTSTKPELESAVQARVNAVLSADGTSTGGSTNATTTEHAQASGAMKLSAQTRARLIAEIRGAMHSELETSANVNAAGTASVR